MSRVPARSLHATALAAASGSAIRATQASRAAAATSSEALPTKTKLSETHFEEQAGGLRPPEERSAKDTEKRSQVEQRIQKRAQRKAALTLTPKAVERVRMLMHNSAEPKMIRVGVRNKGCAGMSYHLEYVSPNDRGRFDELVKQDGVEVLIDSRALFSIVGSEMDWAEDKLSAKFVFTNPNIKDACGCGESFLV
ncbi:Iron-sulfur assembly protein 1 [Malassezia sp. CBS 17886]|nr:Iron-sulfur assembly protein 1 [Malassezia sp. CBS 17886]